MKSVLVVLLRVGRRWRRLRNSPTRSDFGLLARKYSSGFGFHRAMVLPSPLLRCEW